MVLALNCDYVLGVVKFSQIVLFYEQSLLEMTILLYDFCKKNTLYLERAHPAFLTT